MATVTARSFLAASVVLAAVAGALALQSGWKAGTDQAGLAVGAAAIAYAFLTYSLVAHSQRQADAANSTLKEAHLARLAAGAAVITVQLVELQCLASGRALKMGTNVTAWLGPITIEIELAAKNHGPGVAVADVTTMQAAGYEVLSQGVIGERITSMYVLPPGKELLMKCSHTHSDVEWRDDEHLFSYTFGTRTVDRSVIDTHRWSGAIHPFTTGTTTIGEVDTWVSGRWHHTREYVTLGTAATSEP